MYAFSIVFIQTVKISVNQLIKKERFKNKKTMSTLTALQQNKNEQINTVSN